MITLPPFRYPSLPSPFALVPSMCLGILFPVTLPTLYHSGLSQVAGSLPLTLTLTHHHFSQTALPSHFAVIIQSSVRHVLIKDVSQGHTKPTKPYPELPESQNKPDKQVPCTYCVKDSAQETWLSNHRPRQAKPRTGKDKPQCYTGWGRLYSFEHYGTYQCLVNT